MGFFNPALLWALPLVAVPVIIHLLNRRRFNKVPWAAMEYLLRAMKRNRRRMQMEHWIILLLRTLAVAFLVLLVTRPQMSSASGLLQASTHHIVCLDDSASMAQRAGVGSAFKTAVGRINALSGKLAETNRGDLFTLLRSSQAEDKPLIFAARIGADLAKKVRDKLAEQRCGDASLEPGDFLARAKKWQREKSKETGDTHYYLVTDSRAHDFVVDGRPHPGVLKHLSEMDATHEQLTLLQVAPKETDNVGITAVRRRDRLAMAKAPVTLEVEITNFGDEQSQATEIAIEIDNSRVVRPVKPIPAGESETIDVIHTFPFPGFYGVIATLKKDRYAIDDQGVLALEVIGNSPVLVVNGDPGIREVDSETFYLSAALDSGDDVLSGISVTEIDPSSLSSYDLSDYNMVWLANVPVSRPDIVEKLEKYVESGGGLVTFLGNLISPNNYNKFLHKNGEGLLPLHLGELRGDADKPDNAFVADRTHFAIKNNAEVLDLLFSKFVLVNRYFEMIDDPTAPVSVPVRVKRASGSPLIASKTFKQGGYSIVVGTSADSFYSDFCADPSFLVVCQEIHKYATKKHSIEAYNLSSTDTMSLDLDPSEYRRDIAFSALGARAFSATYTSEDAGEVGGKVSSRLTVPMREVEGLGLFQLMLSPHRGSPEKRLVARSAPGDEGRLQVLNKTGWLRVFPADVHDRIDIPDQTSGEEMASTAGEGEIWRFLAIAMLTFLVLETFLAWRFGRR